MMQQDETQLLEPWLLYHGDLFGFENLVVLDHGSNEPEVIAVMDRFSQAGVTVEHLPREPREYARRAEHVARVIRALDATTDYDFVLPLDCDEFLTVFDNGSLSACPVVIHAAFNSLIGEKRAIDVELLCDNVFDRPGWFAANDVGKRFLPAGGLLDIDVGFHNLRSRLADGKREAPFCYLHFHNKPLPVLLAHARRKLEMRVDHRDTDALVNYRGDGMHLVKYFFMTQEEYAASTTTVLSFSVPDFIRRTAYLGIKGALFGRHVDCDPDRVQIKQPGKREASFRADRYLDANPDIRAAGIDPLYHYLLHGWREERVLL
jgi:hypothetical protein